MASVKKTSSLKARKHSVLPILARPVTAREFADLCGVELKTVHGWVSRGLVAHFRTPGRHLRFLPRDVSEFLESREGRELFSRARNGHRRNAQRG